MYSNNVQWCKSAIIDVVLTFNFLKAIRHVHRALVAEVVNIGCSVFWLANNYI